MNFRKIKLLLSCLLILTLIASFTTLHAQSLPQDLSTVNVNNLSNSQIEQLLAQAQSAGLSDSQLLQSAQSRGMSDSQLKLLQQRIAAVRKGNSVSANNTDTTSQFRHLNNPSDTTNTLTRNTDLFKNIRPQIFGADIFSGKNPTFEPNLKIATPVNYVIGPDDQVNINVYGNSVVNWKLNVSPEGNIDIPGVGLVNVSGKTFEQASALIKSKLASSNYAVGHGTSVEVSLGNIRSIKVILIGELKRPGTYTLPSLATVFNALYAAGGPNDNGSFRQIEVIRNNRVVKRLDIYDFLTKGDQKDNINLQDQDIIRVPTYRTRVALLGEVKNPALFEVLPGESLQNVITFAGGFTDQAYTALIKVYQISDDQRRITDVAENDYKNYIPLRGDKYVVDRIIDRYENRVSISGAVFRPGEYELEKGLTVGGLIQKAAGLKEDAFTDRASITRLKSDNTTELISFSIKAILDKSQPDIPLQREDSVAIASIFDLRDKYNVIIKGEVRHSGTFMYADSMSVEDLIIKAGGFAEGASAKRIEVARRTFTADAFSKNSAVAQVYSVDVNYDLKGGDLSFKLKPYDVVSIYTLPGYEKQKTVRVEGEVLYPGYYTIKTKNEKISDILARAGGLTSSADADGGTLKRDNIAILGVDKNKVDTVEIARERAANLSRLKKSYSDSTKTQTDADMRNNYIGINLPEVLKKPGSSIDLLVEDGDEIRIPKQQQIVRVNGEVLYPSAVVYDKHKTFSDYVSNAGGFSAKALRRGAYVVYPNGTVKGTGKFLFFNTHPDVKPGSEIYVPQKPAPTGNSLQTIVGLTTGLASIGAIILGIISLNK
jgi:protein involved in polysaccharide export with SLBB domain